MFNIINGLQMYFRKKKRGRKQLQRNVCIILPNLIKYFSIIGKQLHGNVLKGTPFGRPGIIHQMDLGIVFKACFKA
jgi:hypothetical protein